MTGTTESIITLHDGVIQFLGNVAVHESFSGVAWPQKLAWFVTDRRSVDVQFVDMFFGGHGEMGLPFQQESTVIEAVMHNFMARRQAGVFVH